MSGQNRYSVKATPNPRVSYIEGEGLSRRVLPETGYITQKASKVGVNLEREFYVSNVAPQQANNANLPHEVGIVRQQTSTPPLGYYQQMAQQQQMQIMTQSRQSAEALVRYNRPNQHVYDKAVSEGSAPYMVVPASSDAYAQPNQTAFNMAVTNQQIPTIAAKSAAVNPMQIRNSVQQQTPPVSQRGACLPQLESRGYVSPQDVSAINAKRSSALSPLSYTQAIHGNPGAVDEHYAASAVHNGKEYVPHSRAPMNGSNYDQAPPNFMSVYAGVGEGEAGNSLPGVPLAKVPVYREMHQGSSLDPKQLNGRSTIQKIFSHLNLQNGRDGASQESTGAQEALRHQGGVNYGDESRVPFRNASNDDVGEFDYKNLDRSDEEYNTTSQSWTPTDEDKELARNTDFNANLVAEPEDLQQRWQPDQRKGNDDLIAAKKVKFTLPESIASSPATTSPGHYSNVDGLYSYERKIKPLAQNGWDGQLTNSDVATLSKVGLDLPTIKQLCPWADVRPSDEPPVRHVQIQVKVMSHFVQDVGVITDPSNESHTSFPAADGDRQQQESAAASLQLEHEELLQKYGLLQANQLEMKAKYDEIASDAYERIQLLLEEKIQLEMEVIKLQKSIADSQFIKG